MTIQLQAASRLKVVAKETPLPPEIGNALDKTDDALRKALKAVDDLKGKVSKENYKQAMALAQAVKDALTEYQILCDDLEGK